MRIALLGIMPFVFDVLTAIVMVARLAKGLERERRLIVTRSTIALGAAAAAWVISTAFSL